MPWLPITTTKAEKTNVLVFVPHRLETFPARDPNWGLRETQLAEMLHALDEHQDKLEESCEQYLLESMEAGETVEYHRRKYVKFTLDAARYAEKHIEKRCEHSTDNDEGYDINNNIDRRQWKEYIARVHASGGLNRRMDKELQDNASDPKTRDLSCQSRT